MSYLVRKIARSKWADCDESVEQRITADAVTNCLKTTKNTLSVWFAEQEEDIENAKIALLATLEKFEAVDLIVLETKDLEVNDLELVESDGDTAAKPFIKLHRDIATHTLSELEKVAKLVQKEVVDGNCQRVAKGKFIETIKRAVADNLIFIEDLSDKMAAEIKK